MRDKINFRALGAILVVVFVVFLIFSCAAKKQFWGDAASGYILKYNLPKGVTLTYKASSQQVTRQEMMGQAMEVTRQSSSQYSMTGTGLDEAKNIVSKVRMDSIDINVKSPQGERNLDASAIVGSDFELTVSSVGKKIKFVDPKSIKVNFGMGSELESERFFRDLLPRLAEKPIKVGESWMNSTVDTVFENGLEIVVNAETKSTLLGTETVAGMECLKVASKVTLALEGTGQQGGADIFFEGDGDGTATWYYAYKKGTLVKSTTEVLMEGTATVTGPQNMTISISQETKSQVDLVR